MSQQFEENDTDPASNEYSVSTKEFLNIEKSCEAFKDSDEEIKSIFNEINKLSGDKRQNTLTGEDMDDVELILKRAEDIALETENLLKNSPVSAFHTGFTSNGTHSADSGNVPQIKVTKPSDNETKKSEKVTDTKANHHTPAKHNNKENENGRRKIKTRPLSASVIDCKKREVVKASRSVNSSPKKSSCKHENVLEALKDTNERVKSLELLNVQLTDDNKQLRKKLEQVTEQHHVAELKLVECEKFINKIGKEYENRTTELKALRENESRMMAELNKERNDRKNLKIQRDKDAVVIQDLQRQCKEMEMILRRKHPDSVSALIVAAKSSSVEDNKKKLLEERAARLEQELKDKEEHFQNILLTLQEKFNDMKQKYENHIIGVERQSMEDRKVNTELRNKLNKTNLVDEEIQTAPKPVSSVATQTFLKTAERASSASSRITQNSTLILNRLREDSYLVATIKGLQAELTVKQRTIAKINRETEDLRKNLRSLQKEKEVLMNLNPHKKAACKPSKSTDNILSRVTCEMEAELAEIRKQRDALFQERSSLLESLNRTNEEFITLKKKRIQDLHTLQLAHEKELMQMNMQLYPLQEEIKLLNRTVEILQERVRAADDKLLRYQADVRNVEIHAGGDNPSVKNNKRQPR